jgi:thiol-disulfide isomerase/thioredoxin
MTFTRFAGILLVVGLAAGQAWPAAAADETLIPKDKRTAAPKLALKDVEGIKRDLADLKGKVVVVNFWATWCVPCKVEMPDFAKVHQEYKDRGVEFIGAAQERTPDRDKVVAFAEKLDVRFPIWMESNVYHLGSFKVGPGLPATAIIDKSGRVAARIKGEMNAATLRSLIDSLLAEGVTTAPATGR